MGSFFVAATGQNVGKTTTCLGLVFGLKKRHSSVGFLKPVGQEHVEIQTGSHVDKDVVLFKSYFQLSDPYETMSPVLFPRGFTKDYLDGKVQHETLIDKITASYQTISSKHAITVIEGTGHSGVGSIVDLNNAQVASLLKVPVILVGSGGLGSCFDELFLNFTTFQKYNVPVAGVILNRVIEEKREMILNYIPKALKRWNIPLLGCIPYSPFLSTPTMNDFEILFRTKMISGEKHRLRHFQTLRLIAGSLETYRDKILDNQLLITPALRDDIILATLTKFWDLRISKPSQELKTGFVLTGKSPPKESTLDQLQKANIPAIYAPVSSFVAMKMIHSYTLKFRKEDVLKIREAVNVVEKHIDFEALEKAIRL